jgi:putative FmdB family regulatory protein
MPIYEYLCEDCGQKSTFLVRNITRAPELRCQHCGGSRLRKLVSRVAVLRSEGSGDDFGDEGSWNGEGGGLGDDLGPMGGEDEGGGGEDLE